MRKGLGIVLLLLLSAYVVAAWAEDKDTLRTVSLEEVVISATSAVSGTPVAYTEISRAELLRGNDGQGLPALIGRSPSVVVTSDAGTGIGYSGFRIRGTDANRINITVDGVPLNDSESHGVFWVNMADIASSVESVQIQRGVGTSANGSAAFGATLGMQTQKPEMSAGASYGLSVGSYGTVRHTVKGGTGLLGKRMVVEARYSDIRSDGYIERAWAKMSSYHVAATWYGGNGRALVRFQTFGSAERTYQAWNGVSSAMLASGNRTYNNCGEYEADGVTKFYDNQTDNYWQQHYLLSGSRQAGERWTLHATLHYTRGYGYYEDYKANAKYADYKLPVYTDAAGEAVSRTDLVRRKWLDNDFYGGTCSANYRNRSGQLRLTFGGGVNRYVGQHFGRVMWAKASNSLPSPDYEYYRNVGRKTDGNIFAKAILQFAPCLSGYADMQYRAISYTISGSDDKAGDHLSVDKLWGFFNPKGGVTFRHGHHEAYASLSVAHREPNRDNFTEAAPTERPTHETLYDYEIGYTLRNARFHVGVNLYYMDYDNQLILSGKISEIGEPLTSNIKDSYRTGVELTAAVTLFPCLNWSGSLTLSSNRIKDFTEYVDNWDSGEQDARYLGSTDCAFSPAVIANSLFDFAHKGFSATLTSQYVGRQFIDNTSDDDRMLNAYTVSNLRLGYAFRLPFAKEAAVDLSVNNLFNAQYETSAWVYSYILDGLRHKDDGYFAQAGIHALGRLTLKF